MNGSPVTSPGARPAGRHRSAPPLMDGVRPEDALTLAALGRHDGHGAALARVLETVADPRAAAMVVVHQAMAAIVGGTLAPFVHDRIVVDVGAHDLGPVIGPDGRLHGVWIGRWTSPDLLQPARHLGAQAMRLLGPVLAETRLVTRMGERSLRDVVGQTLGRDCEDLAYGPGARPDRGWVHEFMTGAGLGPRFRRRRPGAGAAAGLRAVAEPVSESWLRALPAIAPPPDPGAREAWDLPPVPPVRERAA